MEDSTLRIEHEIQALQGSHEQLKSSLEQNKRERLRKCREADVLDHWRRQQKQKGVYRHHAKAIPTRDMMLSVPFSMHATSLSTSSSKEYSVRKHNQMKSVPVVQNTKDENSANGGTSIRAANKQDPMIHVVKKSSYKEFHNDYSQHFVDSNERPQNFIRSTSLVDRFNEYPKLQELIYAKDELVKTTAGPPWALKVDLRQFKLPNIMCKFDVIVIDPPWEEYCQRSSATAFAASDVWTYDDVASLDIESVAANPSFIWIWCGNSQNVSRGRQLLMKWGYRRCEDLIWVKTNKRTKGSRILNRGDVFQHTKEHCLMGIKGTVRRSTDSHFIHCNIDTDVIVAEEAPYNSTRKPEELYHIVEHFCLGTRRLELFGEDHNLRPGWLTVGCDLSYSNFTPTAYMQHLAIRGRYLHSTPRIEDLRPKSPPPREPQKNKLAENAYYPEMPHLEHAPHFMYRFPMPVAMPPPAVVPSHMMLRPW